MQTLCNASDGNGIMKKIYYFIKNKKGDSSNEATQTFEWREKIHNLERIT